VAIPRYDETAAYFNDLVTFCTDVRLLTTSSALNIDQIRLLFVAQQLTLTDVQLVYGPNV